MHEIPRDSYACPPRGEDTEQMPDNIAESSPAAVQGAFYGDLEERSDSLEAILEETDDDPEECNQDIDRQPTALEKVPKITYLGAAATDEGKDIITERLKGEIERVSNVPEVTEKYEDRIIATKKEILKLGANEDVDLSERMDDAGDVHIYHRRYTTLIGRRLDLSPRASGVNTLEGIAMIEDKDPACTMMTVTHELLHRASHFEVNAEAELDPKTGEQQYSIIGARVGYDDLAQNQGQGINEALADLMALEVAQTQWANHLELAQLELSNKCLAYGQLACLLDSAISRADDPAGLYSDLKRGMFTGDSDQLDGLIPIIGEDGLDVLKKVSPYSAKSISEVVDSLGYKNIVPSSGRKVVPANLLQWLPRS